MKLPNAYAGNRLIELHRSHVAQRTRLAFYILILVSLTTWQLPLIWMAIAYLLVLICCLTDYFQDYLRPKSTAVNLVVLSYDRGVVATRCGEHIRNVQSFKIEHILCYYIQIYLRYEDGDDGRLYIFPDSTDKESFHKLRCAGVRYNTIAG